MTALPIAELVEDMAIYPRHAIDEAHVAILADAIRSGVTLPPLVADRATKRIVDGWHRLRAFRRILGATGTVEVDLRKYASDAELFLDAVALNAAHGRRLDRVDQVRVVMLAERIGITEVRVAAVLHVPAERIPLLRVRVAKLPNGVEGAIPGTRQVALKRPLFHLAGQTLSAGQAAVMHTVPGTSYLLIVRQLAEGLTHRMLDPADERLRAALVALYALLGTYLAETRPPHETEQ